MDNRKPKKSVSSGVDKNPYDRRSEKVTKKAFKSVEKSVKPVAKDTNKTRRKIVKPTNYGTRSPKAPCPACGK